METITGDDRGAGDWLLKNFNKINHKEIDIKIKDLIYKYYTIDITFKELTNEQINHLEGIKNWW